MAVFLISPLEEDSSNLEEKIKKEFAEPDRFPLLNGRDWLISSHDTSKTISEKLGIKKLDNEKESNPALVVPVSSFWGFGNPEMWDWLEMNIEK